MRVTVCELPHEPRALASAWDALCEHTARHQSQLVLLPECAMVEPFWEAERFDVHRWTAAEHQSAQWLERWSELGAERVVGTRPVSVGVRRFNRGYIWSARDGSVSLRSKVFLPDDPGGWEARWFDAGDTCFPVYRSGGVRYGLNICTELWALETYAAYASLDVQLVLSPRATALATIPKWISVGTVAAVRSGAFSLSSNRVDDTGAYGGAGWIISPAGEILAQTTANAPFATVDIDLEASAAAREGYPCSVFNVPPAHGML